MITDDRVDARPAPLRKEDFTTEEPAETVHLNCVGTFGVASAGHWWGHAASAILRLTHHVLGHEDAIGALIDSEDGNIRAGDGGLTTTHPLGVVRRELTHQMRIRGLGLRAYWLPRMENEDADALSHAL